MRALRELGAGLGIVAVGVLIFCVLTAREARADTWLVETVTSYHFDRSVKHNERNLGFGFERGSKTARFVGGFYDNSNNHLSLYFGGAYTPLSIGSVNIGAMAGPVNGYQPNPRKWWPLVAPLAQVEGKTFGFNLTGTPKVLGHKGVIALQLKIHLEKP